MKENFHRKEKRSWRNGRQHALDTAFRLLARRDHTRLELEAKLRHKGFNAGDVAMAMSRLDELGYLDDAKTARILANHMVSKGYGPLRIRYALGQKGVTDEIIEETLSCCGSDDEQVRCARCALEKKRLRLEREADVVKRYQKAYRFLASRGFPATIIRQVIGDCNTNVLSK